MSVTKRIQNGSALESTKYDLVVIARHRRLSCMLFTVVRREGLVFWSKSSRSTAEVDGALNTPRTSGIRQRFSQRVQICTRLSAEKGLHRKKQIACRLGLTGLASKRSSFPIAGTP